MFGHHHDDPTPQITELPVDVHLEWDISDVISAVDAYLQGPTDALRHALLVELERLDAQTDAADAFFSTVRIQTLAFNVSEPVVGATSDEPEAEEVYGAEFKAQVVLVRAAKHEVTAPTPDTLAALRAARTDLVAVRAQEQAGHPVAPTRP